MPVPIELLNFARQLRKKQTDAENLLWSLLRGRRFCGFKFRRQFPFCGYILDFYCHEALLAIEVDGSGHGSEEQHLYDEERTKVLEASGIKVLRFWNNDVLISIESVLEEMYLHLVTEKAHADVSPSSGRRPPSPSREKDLK